MNDMPTTTAQIGAIAAVEPNGAASVARPRLVLVGGDKGGAGKTTIARALLDRYNARAVNLRVIDSEAPKGALARFYPGAEIVDLTETTGQMRVFDGLPSAAVTLVDLRAGMLSTILRVMRDARVLGDVLRKKLDLDLVHVLGPSVQSLNEAAEISLVQLDGARYFAVKNCANDKQFEWQPGTHAAYFQRIDPTAMLTIPHLDGMAAEAVETAATSFAAFAANEKNSYLLRGKVDKWSSDVFAEFDRTGLAA